MSKSVRSPCKTTYLVYSFHFSSFWDFCGESGTILRGECDTLKDAEWLRSFYRVKKDEVSWIKTRTDRYCK